MTKTQTNNAAAQVFGLIGEIFDRFESAQEVAQKVYQ